MICLSTGRHSTAKKPPAVRRQAAEMTPPPRPQKPERGLLGVLRGAALIAVLAGAVCSVGLLLNAGQRNNSRLVLVLFTMWVLSPFMALVSADVVLKSCSVVTRG